MKRKLLSLLTLAIVLTPATAVAESPQQADQSALFNFGASTVQIPEALIVKEKPADPKPVVYIVAEGDNLTKIGTKHNVKWQRLWDKNKQLKHPDTIHTGDKIIIPLASEKLKKRPIPASVSLPVATPGVRTPTLTANYTGANTYDYGYCTWYVKNKRGASLPNGLGNANTWYSRAQAMGMAVGSKPRAGAVGTTTAGGLGHVVYVESVNANGSVNISEMNFRGWGVQSSRTTSASDFLYIY